LPPDLLNSLAQCCLMAKSSGMSGFVGCPALSLDTVRQSGWQQRRSGEVKRFRW